MGKKEKADGAHNAITIKHAGGILNSKYGSPVGAVVAVGCEPEVKEDAVDD